MLSGFFRVLAAFALASLAAAAVHVLFAHPPAEIVATSALAGRQSVTDGLDLLLKVATHMAVFAAPFVLIAIAVSEGLRVQKLPFYLITGLGIAAMGLYARVKGESPGDPTIVNAYAALAFASAGLVGGYVYWVLAGWRAGGRPTAWDETPATPGPRLRIEAARAAPAGSGETAAAAARRGASVIVAGNAPPPLLPQPTPPPLPEPPAAPSRPPRFAIERVPAGDGPPRLVATDRLERVDFEDIAEALRAEVTTARKTGFVAGRLAEQDERVAARWQGADRSSLARKGDWIVTNLSPAREVVTDRDGNPDLYVIKSETFPLLYERAEGESEHGALFASTSVLDVIELAGGFDIVAPWGERQMAEEGYLVMNGRDVYGIEAGAFKASYEMLD
jgi:hypothetical protein